jgi:hypothetical protein
MHGYLTRQITLYPSGSVASPEQVVDQWINRVNDDVWRGGVAGTWLCSDVRFKLVDPISLAYDFVFTFEYNPVGYKYTVTYVAPDGSIPPDLVEGTGRKDIVWHDSRSFSTYFGS